jgi:signal transduction histidine kinase
MFSRFGLRFRMAASYVAVSAIAVLVVEAVLLAVVIPRVTAAKERAVHAEQSLAQAEILKSQVKAKAFAGDAAAAAGRLASPDPPGRTGEAALAAAKDRAFARSSPEKAEALATLDGQVVVSTSEDLLPVGTKLPPAADGAAAMSGMADLRGHHVAWATSPVRVTTASGGSRIAGLAYAQLLAPESPPSASPNVTDGIGSLLLPGMIVLLLLVPVGGLFGLLSTGRLIRRIQRLADRTTAMADGDLRARIPVAAGDEVGRLEDAFNRMAERLETAVSVERDAAGAAARRAERTRITRELHDSVSQHLYSVMLLTGGLRRALSGQPELKFQAESVERTIDRTMREMRAMLLELRPIELEDTGLGAALDELCRTYEERLGIRISAKVQEIQLAPAVEHAILRVVQESLGNAARHAEPTSIELSVTERDGAVEVLVRDDGRGFDLEQSGERHGMGLGLMRGRVAELGGTVEVESAVAQGTTVRMTIPGGTR